MAVAAARAALCVVRVERQDGGILITLLTQPDIAQHAGGRSDAYIDVDAAVAQLRAFLLDFAQPRP